MSNHCRRPFRLRCVLCPYRLYFGGELLSARQSGERIGVGAADELCAPGGGQFSEAAQYVGSVGAHLLQGCPRDVETDAESSSGGFYQLQQQVVHGQVTLRRRALHEGAVAGVVEVVVVDAHVEEPIGLQPHGLMHLEK